MCFVPGQSFRAEAKLTHPLLSAKIVEWTKVSLTINLVVLENSCSKALLGMMSLAAWDMAIYPASVVLRAISV